MAKRISVKSGLGSILFWSVISAAFIGPGTVTTAAAAGATYQEDLLWALAFSTLACILLQEAAARITIASGYSLGEAIALKFHSPVWKILMAGAVLFGCAAYQTGNILGAVSGVALIFQIKPHWITLMIVVFASVILWLGNYKAVSKFLGFIVALMGVIFVAVATQADIPFSQVLTSAIIPEFPENSGLLIVGLVGTTIVPYNLFLASGISKGQKIKEMRFGISLAILIGGMISMAILLVGTQAGIPFTFQALSSAISSEIGGWSSYLLGIGLFAAGFTSSITAPLASAVTAQSLFGKNSKNWQSGSRNYRLVWIGVLFTGFIFGLLDIKPVPAIILAQAINGFLLPFVAVFLILVINDRAIIPEKYLNHPVSNILMLLVVWITGVLGLNNIMNAGFNILDRKIPGDQFVILYLGPIALIITLVVAWFVYKGRIKTITHSKR